MNTPFFWTVVKADALFAAFSFGLSIVITVGFAIWRKRKARKVLPLQKIEGPRAIIVGGTDPKPGHCPLCGREWTVPGPILPKPESVQPSAEGKT